MADTNERLQQAIAAARAGKTSEAKALAEQIVEENPDNPHALFLLGMLAGSQEEQREYMHKVLELDPDHKAANKRMAQLGPAEPLVEEPVEEVQPQEFEAEPQDLEAEPWEEEASLEETVIGATAVEQETIVGEVEAEELPEYDEMEEEIPAEVEPPVEFVDEPPVEEVEEPLAVDQEEEDFGVAETLAGGVIASEALETVTPDMEEDEDIPDWLYEEARSEEELMEIDETQLWTDEPPPVEEDLPDWLQEDVSEEYVDPYSEEEFVDLPEEEPEPAEMSEESEAVATAVGAGVAADFESFEDETLEEFEEPDLEPAPAERPKRRSSANRGLEILLIILIIIALIVVGVLGYLIISPPF